MKKLAFGLALAVIASPAFAGVATTPRVPEMSASGAIAALALIAGAAAIIRERSKRK